MGVERDGCAVTGPLGEMLRRFVAEWNARRPEARPARRLAGGRYSGGGVPLGAVRWLAQETGLSPSTIEKIARSQETTRRGRPKQVELRVADLLVKAIGRQEAFHDGTLRVVPNAYADRDARAGCLAVCGGSTPKRVPVAARGRTLPDLAAATGFPPDLLLTVLRDEQHLGRVVEDAGAWSLTASGAAAAAPLRNVALIG